MPDDVHHVHDQAALLVGIDVLREAVAKWIAHIPVSLPYVNLMFAFGYATLGDRTRPSLLVEEAQKAMEVPIPTAWNDWHEFEPTVAAVTTNYLFKAFRWRIDQALAGKPHFGPLSGELLAELSGITARSREGGTNNAYLRASYVIDRLREQSRILEPSERVDIFAAWSKNRDGLQQELFEVQSLSDPSEVVSRVRKLLADGVAEFGARDVQLVVLHQALLLSPRIGKSFAIELVELVPGTLANDLPLDVNEHPNLARRQGELLERALFIAGHYGRDDLVRKLTDGFLTLVHWKPEGERSRLMSFVAEQCLRSLKKLGLRDEVNRILQQLRTVVVGDVTLAELRAKHSSDPEAWSSALRVLLALAGGWLALGFPEQATPILDEARHDLLDPAGVRLPPKEYADLAQAYIIALGEGPSGYGLARMSELFSGMRRERITNTFTTASYYSRFHLNLVENTVLALCPR